jgi:hypothetical protein
MRPKRRSISSMHSRGPGTQITDEGKYQHGLNKRGDYEMDAVEVVEDQEEIDYSEMAYVDSQYEYLLKNKDKGITLEELRRRRGVKL